MITVRAKYDGKQILLSEKVEVTKVEEVIVVFLNRDRNDEEEVSGSEIQKLAANSGSLSFLESEQEDGYSDKDLRIKY
jgi:hypothetical protein